MMFIHENGNLELVNVSGDKSGYYQCQTNESGTIRNGSSYLLNVQNPIGSLNGKQHIYIIRTYSTVCIDR